MHIFWGQNEGDYNPILPHLVYFTQKNSVKILSDVLMKAINNRVLQQSTLYNDINTDHNLYLKWNVVHKLICKLQNLL